MCTQNIHIKNAKYKATKKNRGRIPECIDKRQRWIQIGCGKCAECRQERATAWLMRLIEEYKNTRAGQFVTLTIAEEWGEQLSKECKTEDSETIAILAVKRFRERWRKTYKKSPRHFLVTELGHSGQYEYKGRLREKSQRLHLHGILFEEEGKFGKLTWQNEYRHKEGRKSELLNKIWKYGITHVGYSEVNERMINYVTKYITKIDAEHDGFYGRVLASPGIGRDYVTSKEAKKHEFKYENTNKKYKFSNGKERTITQYWKRKIWTDEEREELWSEYLDEEEKYIAGQKIKATDSREMIAMYYTQAMEDKRLKRIKNNKATYSWRGGVKITEIKHSIEQNQIEPNANFINETETYQQTRQIAIRSDEFGGW